MSWGPNRRSVRALAAIALLSTGSAALADILVVRSAGPSAASFAPGKRLAETARISLKPGDQLILLDGRGTRVLRGPGIFTAGAPSAGGAASSAPAGQHRARIGAVRGTAADELRAPSIWHVDVSKSSNVCVADPSKITLWRSEATKALTLDIAGPGGRAKRLAWESGVSTLAWPSDLPVADGSQYRLSWKGGAATTALRFRTLPATPAGLKDIAQTLIRNRCEAQLDLFIETVKLP
ncbi:MAG TPA: hypothetical protein VF548_08965 [Allosphingosinicella sp.]